MKLNFAVNSSWYIWPTLQFMPRHPGTILKDWPWVLSLWWGNRGIQLEGPPPPRKRV